MRIAIGILLLSLVTVQAFAWNDEETHPTITKYAAETYFNAIDPNFMDLSVKGLRARQWIMNGSRLEDAGTPPGDLISGFLSGKARSLNHFHAPNRPFAEAGLTDLKKGISAIRWAQDGSYQLSKGWRDWSWQMVLVHYYNYLTASDAAARDKFQADYLMGLGYLMHLLQDMSQPNHVRNDTHIYDGASVINGLETWAKKNNDKIIRQNILDKSDLYPIPAPQVDLQDPMANAIETVLQGVSPNITEPSAIARLSDTREYYRSQAPSMSLTQGLSE